MRSIVFLMKLMLRAIPDWWYVAITHWPGRLGNQLRYSYYRRRLKFLGQGATIEAGVLIVNPSHVSIGVRTHLDRHVTVIAGPVQQKNRIVANKPNDAFTLEPGEVSIGASVHIAPYAYLLGHAGMSIGDSSGIAAGARLYSISHHYCHLSNRHDKKLYVFSTRVPQEDQALIFSPVVMEAGTALGLNSIMLPGSTIRTLSWVGVLSCVVGEIPPRSIATGVPAKVVKQR